MYRSWRSLLIAAVVAGLMSLPAFAQSVISAQSGLIHYVEGRVFLADRAVDPKIGRFPQMEENEVLRAEEGRAEVLLNPGVFLRVGEHSSIRMVSTRLTDSRLEFVSGTILIEAAELSAGHSVTIFHNDATVRLLKKGLYRLETDPSQLRVYNGEALVEASGGQLIVKKGKFVAFDGTMVAQRFDRELTDSLDRWSGRRAKYLAMANVYAARSILNSGRSWSTSGWGWNPYFGMFTFIPVRGYYRSAYGYSFYSPRRVVVLYDLPRLSRGYTSSGGRYDQSRGYTVVRRTSSGTSGTLARGASAPTTTTSAPTAPITRQSGRAGGRTR
jgi:hypothetical protein